MVDRARDHGESGGLHFTIGSAAGHDSSGDLDLREDLALVKASLLCADRVKLCSPGASVLSGIAEFQESSSEAMARLVVRFLPELQPSMSPQEISFFEAAVGLWGRGEKRRIGRKTLKEILGMLDDQREGLEAMVLEQHKAAGIEGFRQAVRSNVLECTRSARRPLSPSSKPRSAGKAVSCTASIWPTCSRTCRVPVLEDASIADEIEFGAEEQMVFETSNETE